MSLTLKTSRSIAYNTLGKIIAVSANLAIFPYLMSKVEKELYGISVIVLTFSGWLGILDIGVGSAVMKYVSEFSAGKKYDKLEKVFNTSLSFYTAIGVVIAFLLLILSFVYHKIFNVNPDYIIQGKQLIYISALTAFFRWPFIPFYNAICGLNRFDIVNKVDILSNITRLILVYLVFRFTSSFVIYVLISQVFLILYQIPYIFILRKEFSHIKISIFYFDKETFRFIMKFSSYIFIGLLCGIFIFQTDNFLIGIYISAGGVTVYYAASRIQEAICSVNGLLGAPFIAAFSELQGKEEYEKQKSYLFKYTKLETALFIPMVLITFVYSKQFIVNWLGTDFLLAVPTLEVLLLWWFFNGTLLMLQMVIMGKGQTDVFLYPNIINAVSNLILSIVLIRYLGIVGVAIGTTVPMIITTCFLIRSILKRLQLSFSDYWRKSIAPNLLYYFIVLLLAVAVVNIFDVSNIFLTIFIMGATYIAVCLLYFLFFLDEEEKSLVRRILNIKNLA
ncbi:MAG: polysaccharide biosynthesis C-terminal domain-containing protein [Sedimentisphaerales bacterium]|jgi:O-antigen/teichoic acid export membrane protein